MKQFFFTKKDGDVLNKDELFRWLEGHLNHLQNGGYELKVSKSLSKRSVKQNRLMWMWFNLIADELGCSSEDVHGHYCRKFLRKPDPLDPGFFVSSGTSKLDTKQFNVFLDKVEADALLEFGITLPRPEDLYFDEFEREYGR